MIRRDAIGTGSPALIAVALAVLAASPAPAQPVPATRPSPRVGTFDARAVALAYYRSPLHNQRLAKLSAQRKAAKEAGNSDLVKQLESAGAAEQARAHQQVFGNGPYDSLADDLATLLPAVAAAADVDLITAGKPLYARPGTQSTDVTDAVLQALQTDDKTRKMVQDMREKIRAGQYDPAKYKGEH